MTSIHALLFPLAVCAALLVPEYELWCLDDYWSDTWIDAFLVIGSNNESGPEAEEGICPPCSIATRGDNDDFDDD